MAERPQGGLPTGGSDEMAERPQGGLPTGGSDEMAERPQGGLPTGGSVRLGLSSVRNVGDDLAERIVAERDAGGPYRDMEDLQRRVLLRLDVLEALATAGAFGCFTDADGVGLDRRRALWGAGAVAQTGRDRLAGGRRGARPSAAGHERPKRRWPTCGQPG